VVHGSGTLLTTFIINYMKRRFNIIRLWFKRRKAKENLELAKFGGRVVMSMYTDAEIKTPNSIGQYMFQDACSKIDKAQDALNTIQNEYVHS